MSDDDTPGIGAGLRRAREKKGWTTQDVGSRLRLMSRQVEAIEEEEFSKLGPPVFARGFVRNYAKLVGVDPDELLDQMTRVRTTPVPETETVPFKPRPEWWKSPLVLGGVAAALLALGIPIGLYLWLSGDDEEAAAPAVEQVVPPPPPPVAPQQEAQPQATPETQPQTAAPAAPQVNAAPAAPVFRPPFLVPAPAPTTQSAPSSVPAAAQPAPPTATPQSAPAKSPAPAKTGAPRLQFDESAWVQVRDSSGRIVLSGLNAAGTAVDVNGTAPFYLVIGNAEHVRLAYKGQAIDLKPFIAINVARLTLN